MLTRFDLKMNSNELEIPSTQKIDALPTQQLQTDGDGQKLADTSYGFQVLHEGKTSTEEGLALGSSPNTIALQKTKPVVEINKYNDDSRTNPERKVAALQNKQKFAGMGDTTSNQIDFQDDFLQLKEQWIMNDSSVQQGSQSPTQLPSALSHIQSQYNTPAELALEIQSWEEAALCPGQCENVALKTAIIHTTVDSALETFFGDGTLSIMCPINRNKCMYAVAQALLIGEEAILNCIEFSNECHDSFEFEEIKPISHPNSNSIASQSLIDDFDIDCYVASNEEQEKRKIEFEHENRIGEEIDVSDEGLHLEKSHDILPTNYQVSKDQSENDAVRTDNNFPQISQKHRLNDQLHVSGNHTNDFSAPCLKSISCNVSLAEPTRSTWDPVYDDQSEIIPETQDECNDFDKSQTTSKNLQITLHTSGIELIKKNNIPGLGGNCWMLGSWGNTSQESAGKNTDHVFESEGKNDFNNKNVAQKDNAEMMEAVKDCATINCSANCFQAIGETVCSQDVHEAMGNIGKLTSELNASQNELDNISDLSFKALLNKKRTIKEANCLRDPDQPCVLSDLGFGTKILDSEENKKICHDKAPTTIDVASVDRSDGRKVQEPRKKLCRAEKNKKSRLSMGSRFMESGRPDLGLHSETIKPSMKTVTRQRLCKVEVRPHGENNNNIFNDEQANKIDEVSVLIEKDQEKNEFATDSDIIRPSRTRNSKRLQQKSTCAMVYQGAYDYPESKTLPLKMEHILRKRKERSDAVETNTNLSMDFQPEKKRSEGKSIRKDDIVDLNPDKLKCLGSRTFTEEDWVRRSCRLKQKRKSNQFPCKALNLESTTDKNDNNEHFHDGVSKSNNRSLPRATKSNMTHKNDVSKKGLHGVDSRPNMTHGCPRCRYSATGCTSCRNPNYKPRNRNKNNGKLEKTKQVKTHRRQIREAVHSDAEISNIETSCQVNKDEDSSLGSKKFKNWEKDFMDASESAKNSKLLGLEAKKPLIGLVFMISVKEGNDIKNRIEELIMNLGGKSLKAVPKAEAHLDKNISITPRRQSLGRAAKSAICSNSTEIDAVITDSMSRTPKCMYAVIKNIPLVSPEWLTECAKSKARIPWDDFLVWKTRNSAGKILLEKRIYYVRHGETYKDFANLLRHAGATVLEKLKTETDCDLILIGEEEDTAGRSPKGQMSERSLRLCRRYGIPIRDRNWLIESFLSGSYSIDNENPRVRRSLRRNSVKIRSSTPENSLKEKPFNDGEDERNPNHFAPIQEVENIRFHHQKQTESSSGRGYTSKSRNSVKTLTEADETQSSSRACNENLPYPQGKSESLVCLQQEIQDNEADPREKRTNSNKNTRKSQDTNEEGVGTIPIKYSKNSRLSNSAVSWVGEQCNPPPGFQGSQLRKYYNEAILSKNDNSINVGSYVEIKPGPCEENIKVAEVLALWEEDGPGCMPRTFGKFRRYYRPEETPMAASFAVLGAQDKNIIFQSNHIEDRIPLEAVLDTCEIKFVDKMHSPSSLKSTDGSSYICGFFFDYEVGSIGPLRNFN